MCTKKKRDEKKNNISPEGGKIHAFKTFTSNGRVILRIRGTRLRRDGGTGEDICGKYFVTNCTIVVTR